MQTQLGVWHLYLSKQLHRAFFCVRATSLVADRACDLGPTVINGLRALRGLWKIIPIREPRTRRIRSGDSESSPLHPSSLGRPGPARRRGADR